MGFTRCYKTAAFYICPGEILEIILIKTMGVLQWRWPRVQPCHTWMRQLEVDTGLTADILLVMAYILSLMNLLLVSDFGEMTYLRMPRSVCRPNFGDISWSTTRVEAIYFRFWRTNVHPILIMFLVFSFPLLSACVSALAYQIACIPGIRPSFVDSWCHSNFTVYLL